MTQKILIDSSGLVAFVDRHAREHNAVVAIINEPTNEIIIPASAIPEICYVIASRMGHNTLQRFIKDLTLASPPIENLTVQDYARISEVLDTYADLQLDFVDASILALAERLNVRHILTLDRRDFRVLRPRHCEYLELLP